MRDKIHNFGQSPRGCVSQPTNITMDFSHLPQWCSNAVKEIGVPDLLSLPSSMIEHEYHLESGDVQQARNLLMAEARRGLTPVTASSLVLEDRPAPLSLGCPRLDALLSGGLPRLGLTELAGQSGSGKTQLCLQMALEAARATEQGVVYICTEDAFPAKRLEQLRVARQLTTAVTDRILIEHVPDVESLQACCERRVPQLASRRPLCALVIDSVAAQFRCQYEPSEGADRARDIQTLGATLRRLSRQHAMAVLCVNQVTGRASEGDGPGGGVTPALGLAWATQVTTRLLTARTELRLDSGESGVAGPRLMQLRVAFSPHLPPDMTFYQIEPTGVRGVQVSESTPLVPLPD